MKLIKSIISMKSVQIIHEFNLERFYFKSQYIKTAAYIYKIYEKKFIGMNRKIINHSSHVFVIHI